MNKIFGNSIRRHTLVICLAFFSGLFFVHTASAAIYFEEPSGDAQIPLSVETVLVGGDASVEDHITISITDSNEVTATSSEKTVDGDQARFFVSPGSYTVFETALPGYSVVFSGDCAQNGFVEVTEADSEGDGINCVAIQSPATEVSSSSFIQTTTTLYINEVVINDDGDTKTVADFPFDVSVDGVTTTYSGAASTTIFNLSATSTYRVDLTVPSNYSKTLSGDCSTVTGDVQIESVSDTITKLCTITLDDQALVLSDVSAEVLGSNSVKLAWNSNHLATTRVVYDTVTRATTSTAPLYGYAFTTNEDSTYSLHHEVTIIGLTAGTTYFFRAVSHGSPEVASGEVSATTAASTGGGGNFAAGPGNGGGAVAPAAPVAPPQAVLGVKLEEPVTVPKVSAGTDKAKSFATLDVKLK
jgi:hypothetical protein